MRNFIIGLLTNALAIWLTVELVPGLSIISYDEGTVALIVTLVFVAFIFSVVNAVLGTILRVLTFPLYLLTLGLFSIIVNAALLSATAWATGLFGFGLQVDKFWWAGVIGAIVLSLINWVINLVLKPVKR